MKICYKCKIEKTFENFSKDNLSKDKCTYICKECKKKDNIINKDSNKIRNKIYKKNNKDKIRLKNNVYDRNRRKKDPLFKLSRYIRTNLVRGLKNQKIGNTEEILGCTFEELKLWLESLFKDNMSWENYGYYGWHIDHKIPLASAKTEEEIYKLNHYTNLQPLWCYENMSKGKKII